MSSDIPYNIDEESSSPDYIDQQYDSLDEYGSCGEWEFESEADELDIPYSNEED